LYPLAVDPKPSVSQKPHHPPAAEKRGTGIFFVNEPEHEEFFVIDRFRSLMGVVGRPTDRRQGALPGQG